MREATEMAPNPCLPSAPASSCPPQTRVYLCKTEEAERVFNMNLFVSLGWVFVPGFGSAATTS